MSTDSPTTGRRLRHPFAIVPTVVALDPNISHGALRLYVLLCHSSLGTGATTITIEELSRLLQVTERTVARHFHELTERGLVDAEGQGAQQPSLKILIDPAEVYSQREMELGNFPRLAPAASLVNSVRASKKNIKESSLREEESSYEDSHSRAPVRIEKGHREVPVLGSITHPIDLTDDSWKDAKTTSTGGPTIWVKFNPSKLPRRSIKPVILDAEGAVPEAVDDWIDEPEPPQKPEEDPASPWGKKAKKRKTRRRGGRSASGRENCHDLAALFKEEFRQRWPDDFPPDCIDGKLLQGFKRLIEGFGFERAFHLCRVVIWSWEGMRETFKLKQPRPTPWQVYQFRNEIAGVASTGFITANWRRNKIIDEKCAGPQADEYGKAHPLWGVTG